MLVAHRAIRRARPRSTGKPRQRRQATAHGGPRRSRVELSGGPQVVPGDTLLLYTHGLVEHRGYGVDTAISRTAALLSAAPADRPLPDLLSNVAGDTAGDIAVLAVRIPQTSGA
jgi:Stage II sporulation protein E (SpoIIE)